MTEYGPFINDELVGEARAPFRKQLVIADKFGFDLNPNFDPRGMEGLPGLNSRPEQIKQAAEASLKRLNPGRRGRNSPYVGFGSFRS
jgi:aryl-alcohol dehydrogenase-like predicted oxidoreductase